MEVSGDLPDIAFDIGVLVPVARIGSGRRWSSIIHITWVLNTSTLWISDRSSHVR